MRDSLLPLEAGDTWKGLDTLKVVNQDGDVLIESHSNIIIDMDIDPDNNTVVMSVSDDIG